MNLGPIQGTAKYTTKCGSHRSTNNRKSCLLLIGNRAKHQSMAWDGWRMCCRDANINMQLRCRGNYCTNIAHREEESYVAMKRHFWGFTFQCLLKYMPSRRHRTKMLKRRRFYPANAGKLGENRNSWGLWLESRRKYIHHFEEFMNERGRGELSPLKCTWRSWKFLPGRQTKSDFHSIPVRTSSESDGKTVLRRVQINLGVYSVDG